MVSNSEKLVGALLGGIKIMRYLNAKEKPVGVSQVARALSLNPSTAYNLLKTLVRERLAVFDAERKTYAPGPGLSELAAGTPDRYAHLRMVRAHLRELTARHNVTSILWHRSEDDHAVLIDAVESPAAITDYAKNIGQRLPLFIGGMGRCFAAYEGLSDQQLRVEFEKLRWQTAPKFEDYRLGVESVVEKGYAVDEGDFIDGVVIVSSVVRGEDGRGEMAISVLGIARELKGEVLENIAVDIRDRTRALSQIMPSGYKVSSESENQVSGT